MLDRAGVALEGDEFLDIGTEQSSSIAAHCGDKRVDKGVLLEISKPQPELILFLSSAFLPRNAFRHISGLPACLLKANCRFSVGEGMYLGIPYAPGFSPSGLFGRVLEGLLLSRENTLAGLPCFAWPSLLWAILRPLWVSGIIHLDSPWVGLGGFQRLCTLAFPWVSAWAGGCTTPVLPWTLWVLGPHPPGSSALFVVRWSWFGLSGLAPGSGG